MWDKTLDCHDGESGDQPPVTDSPPVTYRYFMTALVYPMDPMIVECLNELNTILRNHWSCHLTTETPIGSIINPIAVWVEIIPGVHMVNI